MKKTNLEIIELKVASAKTIASARIEYNFVELPKHKEIKEDSFFGVKAIRNNSMPKDTANVIYTM